MTLVLSRKKNESIMIDENISVVVVEIRGDKVKLGIEAPKEVPVHRKEVYDAINRGNGKSNYSEFKKSLDLNNFEEAFNIFYNNRGDFGNRDEVNKMYYGLIGKW